MMDSADRMEPAGDSRPIRFEALLDHEKDLIRRANSLLRGIQNDANRSRSASVDDPWAIVDHNRRHRVIMISGPRGSGKTSLMLTLLAGWRAAWTEDWKSIANPQSCEDAKHLFKDMALVVRPLKPLDFDPLPPDLPLYGWIVEAFRPLVRWLANDGQPESRGGLDPDIGYGVQSRTSLPWSDNRKSLLERLQELYQMAIIGWGSDQLRTAFQKDLSDFVLDQEQQHRNWQQLQESWQSFLDDLFKELDRRTVIFPKNGLIVLPIDDTDLQIGRDRELILAIRLLYHRRLVYLLTGDIANLEYVLTLEILGRMMKLDSLHDEDTVDKSKEKAGNLSSSIRKKVLPSPHVIKMDRLNVVQVLEWDEKSPTRFLDKIQINDNKTLRHFLEKLSKIPDFNFTCLLFRDLQQLQDQYMKMPNSHTKQLVAFLEALSSEFEDPDEFTVGRNEEQQIVLNTYPGLIVPVSRVYRSSRSPLLPQNIEVRVGERLEFYQERITKDLSGDKRLVQASPLTLLALDLAATASHVHVHQHIPRIRPPQCLVWSIWHSESYETWLPWPSIWANSPTELAGWADEWGQAVRNLDKFEGDELVDRVAFVWIRLHLKWLEASESQLPPIAESKTAMDAEWSQLYDALRAGNSKAHSSQWFQTELPLLTAPEYGLSAERRDQLLKALLRTNATPVLRPEWGYSREKVLREAKRFPRGQAPEDLFEVFTDYQDSSASTEDRVNILRQEIANVFPNSPWVDRETLSDHLERTTQRLS